MHVLFIAPNFPANQREFVRALHGLGVKVTGIGDTKPQYIDSQLQSWMHGYEQVSSMGDEQAVYEAVRRIQRREWVDRLECTVEAFMLPVAKVRQSCQIPGLTADQVNLCRDKLVMKNYLRERGIACARNAAVDTGDDARQFVEEVGYPVILKPRDGAGAAGTYKVEHRQQLEDVIRTLGLDKARRFITIEEFYAGHEGFYDTLTVNGRVVFEAVSHYYPNVLEAMRTREVNPYVITTNRLEASGYQELREFGHKVIGAMSLSSTPTHMEWFFGNRGLWFSEIGARPPGVRFWDLYCWCNDFDLYTEWARGICFGRYEGRPSRRYSGGLISIRPDRDGHVRSIEGLDEVQRTVGHCLGNIHMPQPGQKTADVGAGYMGHGWMHVRHPDYDELRKILDYISRTVKIRAD
jgi:hypothetical protein